VSPRLAKPLTAEEVKRLGVLAEKVARADTGASNARARQETVWRRLLEGGASKTAIAAASGLTIGALNFRLARGANEQAS
jgi:hypothetical protein